MICSMRRRSCTHAPMNSSRRYCRDQTLSSWREATMEQERLVEPGRAIGFFHQLEERLLNPEVRSSSNQLSGRLTDDFIRASQPKVPNSQPRAAAVNASVNPRAPGLRQGSASISVFSNYCGGNSQVKTEDQFRLPFGCQPPFWRPNFGCWQVWAEQSKALISLSVSALRRHFWRMKSVFSADGSGNARPRLDTRRR